MNATPNLSTLLDLVRAAKVGAVPDAQADYDLFAPVYGALFTDFDDDVSFWSQSVAGAESVCEVGCGSGRISAALAGKVGKMIGVDPSKAMLALALSERSGGAQYRLGDMESLPATDGEFDCVIVPRGAFTHILSPTSQVAALQEAARTLIPGGRLILDNPHYPRDHAMTTSNRARHRIVKKRVGEATHVFWGASRIDSRWDVIESTYWVSSRRGRQRDLTSFSLRTKVLGLSETIILLAAAGFKIENIAGDYDGRDFANDSSRLVCVATRN